MRDRWRLVDMVAAASGKRVCESFPIARDANRSPTAVASVSELTRQYTRRDAVAKCFGRSKSLFVWIYVNTVVADNRGE